MSFCSQLSSVSCPQPLASAWNQPCVTSCGDSRALIHPPPVLVTFPGPILSSCPQESVVGTSCPVGMERPGGLQGSLVYGGFLSSSSSSSSSFRNVWGRRFGGCGPC